MGEAVADKHTVELVSVFLPTTTKHRVGTELFPTSNIATCVISSYSQQVSYGPE